MCLRYLADYPSMSFFTLSPSGRNPVTVGLNGLDTYSVAGRYSYYGTILKSNILFWRSVGPEVWSRLCLILDGRKNVVQVFSGSKMSIRKMLPFQVSKGCCSLMNTDNCAVGLKITTSLRCVSVTNIVHLLFVCVCLVCLVR